LPSGARVIVASIYWGRNTYLSFFCTFCRRKQKNIEIKDDKKIKLPTNLNRHRARPSANITLHYRLPLTYSEEKYVSKTKNFFGVVNYAFTKFPVDV
jgi:hypothetical protein